MTASFNKGATLIALRPLPAVAGRSFSPGDLFPWRRLALAERRVAQMIDQNVVGELTQESYDFCMKQREDGDTVPAGFTADGLAHVGIKTAAAKPKKAAAEDGKKEPGSDYETTTEHRGYTLGGKKSGVVMAFDVMDADGNRLNPGGKLRGMKSVDKFIDTLDTAKEQVEAKDSQSSQTSEGGGDPAPADASAAEGEGYGDQ